MHVAQWPASHDDGAGKPPHRADWRIVERPRWSTVFVCPRTVTVTLIGSTVVSKSVGAAPSGVNRSMLMRASSTSSSRSAVSTTSMNPVGPHT